MQFLQRRTGLVAATAAVATAVTITLVGGCGGTSADDGGAAPDATDAPKTSTTRIAGANVLGNQRRPDESCAPDPAPLDEGPQRREVRHAAGSTEVPADPQRIVVLSGDQLDALCALGLQSRIVGAAVPEDTHSQPSYLGAVVHDVPAVGVRSTPDLEAVRTASPDLILGSDALTPEDFGPLSEIAPTVFTGPPGAAWRDTLQTVAEATGRGSAAGRLIEGFDAAATDTGVQNDATHFQASVARLTDTALQVYGRENFPGSVLAAVGADRPGAQRFTDKPYVEIDVSDPADADLSAADGDIVYVSFASPDARDRASEVFDSDAWRQLSAVRDGRVFVVNDEVWQTGDGIVAARGILADLRSLNTPIN